MPETMTSAPISVEQYRALQRPIVLPTPQQLFDQMVERLKAKFEGSGIFKPSHADPFRRGLPYKLFLLVPPQPKALLVDRDLLNHVVSLVEANGKTGKNYLDPKDLKDLIEIPEGPSLLMDIEDGNKRRDVKPSVSRENIKAEGRHPYTTWMGIVHAIVFPEVFQSHNMDLVGSRSEPGSTPFLSLGGGGGRLDAVWGDDADPKWGAPSCGSVIGA